MKELNIYWIGVNIYGPYSHTKSGSDAWFVCETSEKNAKKALQNFFAKQNFIGSSDDIQLRKNIILNTEILPRGACMRCSEYFAKSREKEATSKNNYVFSPKKSEKGLALHKINKQPAEYNNKKVPGAFGVDKYPVYIEDCGDLPDIECVTFEGQTLSNKNLYNLIEEIEK